MSYSPNFRGSTSTATSEEVGDRLINTSGGALVKATPVRIDTSGEIRLINVSVEAEALSMVGIVKENISDGTSGVVISSGRIENIVTTANNGDVLYVSKTGGLTNIKPDVGVGGFIAGDFIIRVGVVFKNENIPTQQDLLLNIDIVGQL